jgi:hypothetical protein
MALDAAVMLQAVRWTARMSALLLAVNLVVASRRLHERSGSAGRASDIGTFAAFIGSHTVHFICLILLASATGGRSISDSGGWTAAMLVATVFYLGCAAVLRVKMRFGTGWRTRGQRRTEAGILALLWLVFFQAYAGRSLASLWFAGLAAGLLCALVTLASRLKSSLVPADPNALQSV